MTHSESHKECKERPPEDRVLVAEGIASVKALHLNGYDPTKIQRQTKRKQSPAKGTQGSVLFYVAPHHELVLQV